eukprot:Tamp_25511.p1 GENE.Tamp_25511~~Tamp_25511.p1  ORF type:complete len:278 (-),score=46.80 Tamp_25511:43-876(-)
MISLFKAVRRGNVTEVVRQIQEEGASPYWRDVTAENMQPLHLAAVSGHPMVCEAIYQLLNVPECLGSRDGCGRTPLHTAAMLGLEETVVRLFELGALAYIDAQDRQNKTALHHAAACLKDHHAQGAATCELLLQYGAQVDARDERQRTPLMMAADTGNGQACATLLRFGADSSVTDVENQTAADLAWSLEAARFLGTVPRQTAELKDHWHNLSSAEQSWAEEVVRTRKSEEHARFEDMLSEVESRLHELPDDGRPLPDMKKFQEDMMQFQSMPKGDR